jgi:hypothetical protein
MAWLCTGNVTALQRRARGIDIMIKKRQLGVHSSCCNVSSPAHHCFSQIIALRLRPGRVPLGKKLKGMHYGSINQYRILYSLIKDT